MQNTKSYSHKIPAIVRNAMHTFAKQECVLVKRDVSAKHSESAALNCHANVANKVVNNGGEVKSGWLLCRNNTLLNAGIWVWSFHSVWLTADNNIFDVTDDKHYIGNAFSTVWLDSSRTVNLDDGVAFNNVIVIERQEIADRFNVSYGCDLKAGETYWTTTCMRFFRRMDEHSGEYLMLNEEYKDNLAKLDAEKEKQVNGMIHTNMLFDFSISMQ